MLKLGFEIKQEEDKLGIKLIDPSKKQLETATEDEKIMAQVIKDVLDEKLLELLEEKSKTMKEN